MTNEPTNSSFGYWVRRRRLTLDLTQAELGRRAGASAAMIRKIEADERRPSRELAELLAATFELSEGERAAFLRAARQPGAVDDLPAGALPTPLADRRQKPQHNLPAPLTSFVNRKQDIATVTNLVRRADVRILTLLGPPGIGKTRLSIRAAEMLLDDFPDGVCFVDLTAIDDPTLVLPTVAHHLGIFGLADRPLVQQFRNTLGQKQMLLVLDNCEQVVDAAPQISDLLRACGGLKVLATSRLPLHVYGEHEYAAPPLAQPPPGAPVEKLMEYEAVTLFVARIRQHQPAFTVDATNAGPVLAITAKLEGIPLAIELAAAALRTLSVVELATAVSTASGWVRTIKTLARDLPPRQRTLADAIAWSYDLLDHDLQTCLRRCAVFAGAFDDYAVAAVCSGGNDGRAVDVETAAAWTTILADHSLLARDPGRWRLLEMIREYAWLQMEREERALAQSRHAVYYAELLSRAQGNEAAIEQNYVNLITALHYWIGESVAVMAVQMCEDLATFWETRGLVREGQALIRQSLALPVWVDPERRISILFKAANLCWQCHDFSNAYQLTEEAIAIAEVNRLSARLAGLFNLLGRIAIEQGDYARAEASLRHSVAMQQLHSGLNEPGFPLLQLGEVAWARGDFAAATALFAEADDALPPTVPNLMRAMLHTDRAELALARGDCATAIDELRLALPHARAHVRRLRFWLVTLAGLLLTGAELSQDDAGRAAQCLVTAETLGEGSAPLSPIYADLIASRIDAVRAQMGDHVWLTLRQAARQWTPQEATVTTEGWLASM